MTAEIKFHPLARLGGPLMEGEEFDALVADIKANGLLKPIAVFDGMILDGRNRFRACKAAGVHLVTDDIDGWIDDPAAYVISANIHRRHLTPEQKRALLVELVKASPEKSDRTLAREAKVAHHQISRARRKAEATGTTVPVEKRTGADGKARKTPAKKPTKEAAPKPVKSDPRIISPELGERVGRFANDLILCDRLLAVELKNLIMLQGVRERLAADLTNGLTLDDGADPGPLSEILRRGQS
jgi:ParB-like chromosome segregation protein Spo0J